MGNNIEKIKEEWRDIVGYEGLYQVSNLGKVKSLNYNKTKQEKILRQGKDKDGYLYVILYKDGKMKSYKVHRLVAIAFIPNPDNLPQINHIDEDKTNNCVDNLEWCTAKYNVNYGSFQQRRVASFDWKTKVANTDYKAIAEKISKPILQCDLEGIINEFPSIMEAERQTGFKHSNICACLKGKYKTCGGYIWKYKE